MSPSKQNGAQALGKFDSLCGALPQQHGEANPDKELLELPPLQPQLLPNPLELQECCLSGQPAHCCRPSFEQELNGLTGKRGGLLEQQLLQGSGVMSGPGSASADRVRKQDGEFPIEMAIGGPAIP